MAKLNSDTSNYKKTSATWLVNLLNSTYLFQNYPCNSEYNTGVKTTNLDVTTYNFTDFVCYCYKNNKIYK